MEQYVYMSHSQLLKNTQLSVCYHGNTHDDLINTVVYIVMDCDSC